MPVKANSAAVRRASKTANPIVSKAALGAVGSQGGALTQQQGADVIAGLSDAGRQRLLSIQSSPAQRNVLLRGRPDSPPSVSRIQQAQKRPSTLTPAERSATQAKQLAIDRDVRVSQSALTRDRQAVNKQRVAAGRPLLRDAAPPVSTTGVPGDTSIFGIPVAGDPAFFEQNFTGPKPATQIRALPFGVSAPPIPGLPGSVEAITGADMQRILAAAGIPFHSAAENTSVANKRSDDPYAGFFTPDRTVQLTGVIEEA